MAASMHIGLLAAGHTPPVGSLAFESCQIEFRMEVAVAARCDRYTIERCPAVQRGTEMVF